MAKFQAGDKVRVKTLDEIKNIPFEVILDSRLDFEVLQPSRWFQSKISQCGNIQLIKNKKDRAKNLVNGEIEDFYTVADSKTGAVNYFAVSWLESVEEESEESKPKRVVKIREKVSLKETIPHLTETTDNRKLNHVKFNDLNPNDFFEYLGDVCIKGNTTHNKQQSTQNNEIYNFTTQQGDYINTMKNPLVLPLKVKMEIDYYDKEK